MNADGAWIGCVAGVTLAGCLVGSVSAQTSRAFYRIELETHWTSSEHGSAYTPGAHFSWPVGMIHSDGASMWEPGGIASPGLELMAEAGRGITLFENAEAFVDQGLASEAISGRGLQAEDTYAWNRWFSTEHHRLTLVFMIAPSPDWFVGTHGLSLVDSEGEWVDEIVIPLEAYDSGTDSGLEFVSANADTQPPEPIRNIQVEPPFDGVSAIATMRLILQSVEECPADLNQDGQLTPADFNAWVQAFNAQSGAADQNGDGAIDPADFNAWVINFNAGC
ncbi:MAG: spondin domain-containing protein [Planctomycetota bacterium]